MRRVAGEGAEGSLEMLLDTITNAFGGILFLGLLIAVILRTTGKADVVEGREHEQIALADVHRSARPVGDVEPAFAEPCVAAIFDNVSPRRTTWLWKASCSSGSFAYADRNAAAAPAASAS